MTKAYSPSRLVVYVVSSDDNLAPNVTTGICSLTVCKPVVRKQAVQGADWIIGMSTTKHGIDRIIYAMQVDEKLGYDAYYNDPRFADKKPSAEHPNGDNFFKLVNGELEITTTKACHYGKPEKIKRDLNTPVAVLGKRFWYFGANAPRLPEVLRDTRIVTGNRRGHRYVDDPEVIAQLVAWLEANYEPGIHGQPRDV